ncbi:MAG: ROK family protein [Clostridia bacterium]|nr:ROK family protein [Clostridia bacterium]
MKIGIDLGGSHIGIGVVKNEAIIEKKETEMTPEMKTIEAIETYLLKHAKAFMSKYEIEQIGIAVPGNVKNGIITSLINLGIQNWNLKEIIR